MRSRKTTGEIEASYQHEDSEDHSDTLINRLSDTSFVDHCVLRVRLYPTIAIISRGKPFKKSKARRIKVTNRHLSQEDLTPRAEAGRRRSRECARARAWAIDEPSFEHQRTQ